MEDISGEPAFLFYSTARIHFLGLLPKTKIISKNVRVGKELRVRGEGKGMGMDSTSGHLYLLKEMLWPRTRSLTR